MRDMRQRAWFNAGQDAALLALHQVPALGRHERCCSYGMGRTRPIQPMHSNQPWLLPAMGKAQGSYCTMTRPIILVGDSQRAYAKQCIDAAKPMSVVTVKDPTRTNLQNAKMHSMLADLARSKPQGHNWTPDTWKAAMMHLCGHQVAFCQGLDDSGPFPMGFRSSQLTTRQMADLIECMYEYGARHGVVWTEPEREMR